MKENFIKFRKGSVHLASMFASAIGDNFDGEDIASGRLVAGTFGDGKYLAIGWLRGMTQDKSTGRVICEVFNAVEDEFTTVIEDARHVDPRRVPVLAARYSESSTPFVGRPFACNGEKATFCTGESSEVVSTEFIYRLEPLFKETK